MTLYMIYLALNVGNRNAILTTPITFLATANAAKMFSVAAAYGFISDTNQIKEWESDYIIDSPLDLKNLIS